MIYTINCISGTPITEKNISQERSEDYKKYIRTTSTLFPWCKLKDMDEVVHTQIKISDQSIGVSQVI